ncbi:hypothetical protein [Parapedobacter tibetensis]|uniref:hypothetical protein n=1 Tax=Parapedobacter tibetensis TaxID=2972951 RepID=UPI00214DDE55|nr:hypothetical protein [Parapedobacter tibetensis]
MNRHSKITNELIFVLFEGYEGGYTAIEGNVGLVAMGDDDTTLEEAVRYEVEKYYGGTYHGVIRIRKLMDKVITIAQ